MMDQVYTLTDPPQSFTYNLFGFVDDDCPLRFRWTVFEPEVGVALSYNPQTKTWVVFYEDDLELAGPNGEKDYTITITGFNPEKGVELTTDFVLTILNPCQSNVDVTRAVSMPGYCKYYLYEF